MRSISAHTRITSSAEKKELLIFLSVAYGLPLLMTIPMAILSHLGKDLTNFLYAQGFYPAAGIILAKLICVKEKDLMPKRLFNGFLIVTGIMILWCFTGFIPGDITLPNPLIEISVVIMILYFLEKKEKRNAYQLAGKNWRTSAFIVVLFIAIFYLNIFIDNLVLGELPELLESFSLANLPSFLLIATCCFSLYIGEEYGWRTYFQPLLQKKFGLIKGVLLFGVFWELWHWPLVVFVYIPTTQNMGIMQLIVFRFASVILLAIFLAYSYMRTNNIWVPILIHFLQDNLGFFLVGEDSDFTWMTVGILILSKAILFLPFLFFKGFRQQANVEGD